MPMQYLFSFRAELMLLMTCNDKSSQRNLLAASGTWPVFVVLCCTKTNRTLGTITALTGECNPHDVGTRCANMESAQEEEEEPLLAIDTNRIDS
jgi:hypothetical protein